jgi:molybdenum cofactor cytidylyltransferase
LVHAFLALPEPKIVVPVYGGRRGNPIVLPGKQRRRLLAGGVKLGCRNLIERHPKAVVRIEAPNAHDVQDIDLPAAYDAWVAIVPRAAQGESRTAGRLCPERDNDQLL